MIGRTPIAYRAADAFFRYKHLFVVAVVVIGLLPSILLARKKPQFSATALVLCQSDGLPQGLSRLTEGSKTGFDNIYISIAQNNSNRFNEWLQDDRPGGFMDRALHRAELVRPLAINPKKPDPRVADVVKGLHVAYDSDTVLSINLTWPNGPECEEIVKAFQQEYIDEVGNARQRQTAATSDFLDDQLNHYLARMRESENALIDFKQKNSGNTPEAQSDTIIQLSTYRARLDDQLNNSHNGELRRKVLMDQIKTIKPTSVLEQHIANSPVMAQISDLQTKRSNLIVEGWLPESDRVKALDSQIAELQKQMKKEADADSGSGKNVTETVLQDNPEYRKLTQDLTQATIDENTQKAQIAETRALITKYEGLVASMPQAEANLNDRTRDFNILKTQYEDLVKRKEQAQINRQLDKLAAMSALRPIGTILAQTSSNKKKTMMMLIGLVIVSLIVGFGLTLVAEWADPTIRYGDDVATRLDVPLLICITDVSRGKDRSTRQRAHDTDG